MKNANVRIVKVAECSSLSGKSMLGYFIGTDGSKSILLKVTANSGGGYFSSEWVGLDDIQATIAKSPSDKPLTSYCLSPLFKGRSNNSWGFLWAVLLAEGLVTLLPEKDAGYAKCDAAEFIKAVGTLIESGVSLGQKNDVGEKSDVGSKTDVTAKSNAKPKKALKVA